MTELFNTFDYTFRRKELRNAATLSERFLWSILQGSQLGHKFRRQAGIGPYIVDFYCPRQKLAIELDGKHHLEEETKEKDTARDQYLFDQGVRVLRFQNSELDDLAVVITKIKSVLEG
jgi:very-short-patch-repair endonuclease